MKEAKTALKLILPFIVGILVGEWLHVPFIISFTLWASVLLVLIVILNSVRIQVEWNTSIGFSLVALFFFSGLLGHSANLTTYHHHHYNYHYLPGDELIVEIEEYQPGQGDYDKALVMVNEIRYSENRRKVEGRLLCYIRSENLTYEIGDQLAINARLMPIKNDNNPGSFDQEKFWGYKRINQVAFVSENQVSLIGKSYRFQSFWEQLRNFFKSRLSEHLTESNQTLAVALALGDKSLLAKETRDSFAHAGAMHVLAVSGLHVGILLGIIQWLCFRIKILRKKNRYILISVVLIWCFAFLTGLSPSVLRAAIMFSILAFGQLKGMSFFSLNGLIVSALFLLIIDAYYLFDIGFQLSYLAMLGISFFYRKVNDLIVIQNKVLRWFWNGTALGIAAQIGTLPISLYYFHQFPNYFILTNLGLMIMAGVALGSVLLFMLVQWIPILVEGVAWLVDFIFTSMLAFITFVNELPTTVTKGFQLALWQVIIAYGLIYLLWYFSEQRNRRAWFASASLALILAIIVSYERDAGLNNPELVVFNQRYPTIAYKEKGKIVASIDDRFIDSIQLEKLKFPLFNYQQQVGGELMFIPFPSPKKDQNQVEVSVGESQFELSAFNTHNKLKWGEYEFILPYSNYKEKEGDVIINGPWNKFSAYENARNIDDGAIVFK